MRYFIVHAHPEPRSLNGALTRTAAEALTAAGHEFVISDLYAMRFDPVSDRRNFTTVKDPAFFKQQQEELFATERDGFAPAIATEMAKVERCDVLVFQFPLWWFGLPAILKGWVDRVFAMGRTYGGGRWYDDGVFKGKRAMLSLTTGGPETMYGPDGLNGDLDAILFPINHGILAFTGFAVVPPFVAWAAAHVGDARRADYLRRYADRLLRIMELTPIAYPPLHAYEPGSWRLRRV